MIYSSGQSGSTALICANVVAESTESSAALLAEIIAVIAEVIVDTVSDG